MNEYKNFDDIMRKLISVPHEEIKKELDAEKAAKQPKRRKTKDHNDRRDQNEHSA